MLPAFSPIIIHTFGCPTCGATLVHLLERTANGKLTGIVYYCLTESCLYRTDGSFEYARTQVSAIPAKDIPVILAAFDMTVPAKLDRPIQHLTKPPQRNQERGYRTDEVAKPSSVPVEHPQGGAGS